MPFDPKAAGLMLDQQGNAVDPRSLARAYLGEQALAPPLPNEGAGPSFIGMNAFARPGLPEPLPRGNDPLEAALVSANRVPGAPPARSREMQSFVREDPAAMRAHAARMQSADAAATKDEIANTVFAQGAPGAAPMGSPASTPPPPKVSYGPTQVIPEHWTPTGRTTQEGTKFSDATLHGYEKAQALGNMAAQDEAAGRTKQAHREEQEQETYVQRLDANQARLEGVTKNNADDLAARRRQIDDLAQEVKDGRVDPDHFWHTQSTGKKIGHVLNSVIGGWLAGYRGGENQGLKFLNAEIDKDIGLQKDALNSKRAAIGDMRTAYGLAAQDYAKEEDRIIAARLPMKEALNAKIEAAKQNAGTELAKARLEQLQADLQRSMTKDQSELEKSMSNHVSTAEHFTPRQVIGGGPAGGSFSGPITREAIMRRILQSGKQPSESTFKWAYEQLEKDEARAGERRDKEGVRSSGNMKWLAEQEGKSDLPQTEQSANNALRLFSGNPSGSGVAAATLFEKSPTAYKALYGEDATAREQEWQKFRNQSIKALSGSGVSGAEMSRMTAQLDAANDAASRRRAAESVKQSVEAQRGAIRAGVPESDAAEYYKRSSAGAAPAAPPTPKGFKP